MRLDVADTIKVGHTLYNCFMEPVVVTETVDWALDPHPSRHFTQFVVKDSKNQQHIYSYKDLYLPELEEEDDAEKSWVNWAKDNKDFLTTFDHIETMREIYRLAYYNGYNYRQVVSYEEMMQK